MQVADRVVRPIADWLDCPLGRAGGLQGCEAYRRNVIIGPGCVVMMSAITTTRCTVDHRNQ